MTGIGQKVAGLSSEQEEEVINAYVKATGNAAQVILIMIRQIAEKVPFHMNFFSCIRLVSVVIGVLMVWFISLLLKNRRQWLRLRGLVTVAFALPTFITVLRMLMSGAASLSGALGEAMKSVKFIPLTLRSAAAVFTGAVMLIMGIKLKRAENAPEYATVPVVLQEFDEGEKF